MTYGHQAMSTGIITTMCAAIGAISLRLSAFLVETLLLDPCRYHTRETGLARLFYVFPSAEGCHPIPTQLYRNGLLVIGGALGAFVGFSLLRRWQDRKTGKPQVADLLTRSNVLLGFAAAMTLLTILLTEVTTHDLLAWHKADAELRGIWEQNIKLRPPPPGLMTGYSALTGVGSGIAWRLAIVAMGC